MNELAAITLAAGKSKRMKSDTIKVLHKICGKYVLEYVTDLVESLDIKKHVIVVGHQKERVKETFADKNLFYAEQNEQKGTGHAVMMAEEYFQNAKGDVLILCGDVPLLKKETLENLYKIHKKNNAAASVLTAHFENPFNYGRIIKDEKGNIQKIVEEKDASMEEKKVQEINSGIYLFDTEKLFHALQFINTDNAQGELYLTDVIEILKNRGEICSVYMTNDSGEIQGINTREHLWNVTKRINSDKIKSLMVEGVTFLNPETVHIDKNVIIEQDTIIYPNVVVEGKTSIGKNCIIKPFTYIKNKSFENNSIIEGKHD